MLNFEEIYHNHKKMVYNLVLSYVQNTQDAEEIMQDVFVIVYEKLPTFKNNSSLRTWIYRISINKSLDFIKSKKAKKRFGFFTSFSEKNSEIFELTDYNHPGILLENKQELEKLFSLINELNDNQKTVIILNKIEQKSLKEIAEIMNISEKAVESTLQRAKQNLKTKGNY